MREVRFRAWNKRTAMMEEDFYIRSNGSQYDLAELNYDTPHIEIEKVELEIMQYTGIKDQNGVEIFEGDIVAIENHPFEKTDDSDIGVKINGNYEVGWNEDDLTWCAGSLLLARVGIYVRIIGNIYENSDLLEVSE